jgi:hypothetical protein
MGDELASCPCFFSDVFAMCMGKKQDKTYSISAIE